VLRNDRPVAVAIKTGISDGTRTEILEGELKAGDEVITDIAGTSSTPAAPGATGRNAGGFRRML
jgi:HlyD family secretion protein